ncbi:DUF885 domain-containing protein [Blautia wexlerae]|nr:DUF885 domain-containing protein [Blautia wexlerae]
MRIYKNIPKRILSLCLVFAIGISMGVLSDHFVSENSRFQTFTEKLFRSEVCDNTLTLHYTLAHPEKKGIRKPEATLGTALSDPAKTTSLCQEYEKELKSFAYSRLSEENRLTCDMLLLYFHTRASLGKNSALDEPLGPGLGVQAQLPILLAEYTFRTKEDISDYLKLLSTVRPYFQSIIKLEKQKSQSGLFMSDTTLDRILKQCHSFVANPDSNYMDDIFAQKLKAFSNPAFSDKDQKKLCTYHHKLILTEVIPAYQELADSLESLRGTGKSSRGLAFFEGGREYYLYLLCKSQTGTYVPVGQIEKRLSAQLLSDYREISSLLEQNSSLIDRLNQCSGELTLTPTQMLEKLPELMKKDFPELKDATYELRTVHPSMKKFLSPAFYLTPPVDTRTPNVIYINDSGRTSSLELFGTLAHEGFPGHLYQTVSFAENNPSDIRYLVTSSGYVEGWATYVESYGYEYAASLMNDPDSAKNAVRFAWLNRSMNLCIYSLIDIGIHYRGWDASRTAVFLKAFGINNASTVAEIYQYIVETPGNYLKYYWGYLNFLDLKTVCQKRLGDDFDLKEFHRRILDIGPVQFPVLEKIHEINELLENFHRPDFRRVLSV